MTLLSRKADYALLILSHLYQHSGGGNAREIAERFGLSRPFVANILKELGHRGYVASHRGVKGGYVLRPTASAATLAELLSSIDEGFRLTLCTDHPVGSDGACALEAACPVKNPLADIHRRIVDVLRAVTLGDLFAPPTGTPTPPAADLLPVLRAAACCGAAHACHSEPAPV